MAGRRPGGVVLIAVLAWIGAIAQIFSGVVLLTGAVSVEGLPTQTAWIAIIVGVISFLVAFFLFSGSRVARVLVTISFLLSLASAIYAMIAHPANLVSPIISAALAVIGLILLYTKAANDYFRG